MESIEAFQKSISSGSAGPFNEVFMDTTASSSTPFDPLSIASVVLPVLYSNGGKVHVAVSEKSMVEKVQTAFLLAGISVQSEKVDGENRRVLSGEYRKGKNSVTAGRLNFSDEKKSDDGYLKSNKSAIKINIDEADFDDEDDDMIDEDTLLDAGLIAPPPELDMEARKAVDDCGGRKPCDDCTCGRAEREANEEKQSVVPPSSSCGNCSKGDAFRCAGCPYLGKPAFKPGEEHLVLDLQDDL